MIEWVYELYIELMVLPAPLRMAILIIVGGILVGWGIVISLYCLKGVVYVFLQSSNTLHEQIGGMIIRRRKNGKNPIIGTGLFDGLLSLFINIFTKLKNLIQRLTISPKLKKSYTIAIILFTIGFPLLGILSPTGNIGTVWEKFERQLISKHLVPLGYDSSAYKSLAAFSIEKAQKYYIKPNDNATKGVYIRQQPSVQGPTLDVLSYGEEALYLDETQEDSRGIKWYKIETKTEVKGWVSSKVVEIYE